MLTHEEKMNLLVRKVVEVLVDTARERVPEQGPFRKVFVTYDYPETDLHGMLAVEEDLTAPGGRRVSAGMFREGRDRLVSNYLYKGSKREVLDWLQEEKRIPELIESYEYLKEKTESFEV